MGNPRQFPCWQFPGLSIGFAAVIGFLRFVGVMNAAIWFGSAVFFTFLVTTVFHLPEILKVLDWSYSGWVLQFLWARYFDLQLWCAGVALLHLVAECVYLGRPLSRFHLFLLVGLLCSSLIGGFLLQPKVKQLHIARFQRTAEPKVVKAAERAFPVWNGVTQFLNYLTLLGIMVYLWQVTGLNAENRFGSKFRS